MNDEQIEKLAKSVATETVNALSAADKQCDFCGTEERRVNHRQEHEFLRTLIKIADKMENAKWGIGTAVLKALLIAGILGALAFAWKHGVKAP